MMRSMLSRCLALGLLCVFSAVAGAQVQDITPKSEAQQLSCLQRPDAPPKYPEHGKYDDTPGFMRVLLRFSKPDEAPAVEVLANTAREDMQDGVYRYLKGMRLPCLTPEDGTVQAVQEFAFKNSPLAPLPVDPQRDSTKMCIVMPREDMAMSGSAPRHPQHVVIAMVFNGDGTQAPEVKVIHSNADKAFERAVRDRAAQYRMACRKAGEKPVVLSQFFSYRSVDTDRYVFNHKLLGLVEFLRMTEGIKDAQADFDLNTMGCPFKLNYTILGPSLPNEVKVGAGRPDPNKIAFLRWIRSRQIAFRDADMANDLFGQTLQIDVPCGHLNLEPKETAASAVPAASAGG